VNAKKTAAEKAVGFIKNGMTIGLGTGSTAGYAIEAVGELVKNGLSVKAVASSLASEQKARDAGLTIAPFSSIRSLDLYIDGADEVDRDFNLIKGGGGALLREKILAYHSKEFIVIVDDSKLVKHLGRFPLAVEITSFAWQLTTQALEALGCTVNLRKEDSKIYTTDNGNLIADCAFEKIEYPEKLEKRLQQLPGVVECGLFLKYMVGKIIVGYENGNVKLLEEK
jgi:ribose 5-phosphate isomerase A